MNKQEKALSGTWIFLQARTTSKRLPSKVLKKINGKTLLKYILDRFATLKPTCETVVLTCSSSIYAISDAINDRTINLFVGSEHDVLERFYYASKKYKPDTIVRATADNPFTCLHHLQKAIEIHNDTNADLTTFKGLPLGTGIEVIHPSAIERAYYNGNSPHHREHVTPYIYENSDKLKVNEIDADEQYHRQDIRLTVDEEADLVMIRKIIELLELTEQTDELANIINIIENHKELQTINKNVKQKSV